jgi:C-terminal processing protease CtpA/Prc
MNMVTQRQFVRIPWCSRAACLTATLAFSVTIGLTGHSLMAQELGSGKVQTGSETPLIARYWLQEEALPMQGYASGSFLGIGVMDVTPEIADLLKMETPRGVTITAITQGSPAEKAGLQVKDVLISYNGTPLEGGKQLTRMVGETPAGRTVRLEILRDGQPMEVSVTTAARRSVATISTVSTVRPVSTNRMSGPVAEVPKIVSVYSLSSLGVDAEALGSQLASYFGVKAGALVREVAQGSPADKAGVRAGDVIIYLGERSVTSPADLSRILRERTEAMEKMKLGVVRHQQEIVLHVVPSTSTGGSQFEGSRSFPNTPRGVPISSTKH